MAFNTANANVAAAPAKRSFFLGAGFLIPTILVVFLGIFLVSNFIKFQKLGVTSENAIEAQYDSNQNNLGQLTLKVKEALGVAKVNNADLERIIKSSLEGRYGSDGQGAKQAMLWVKENYPGKYDPQLMVNVQQAIIAGRTDFEAKQNLLIDKTRVYKDLTEVFWSGTWLKLAGFPRSSFDWKKYKPVISQHAKEAFETHIDEGMDIK